MISARNRADREAFLRSETAAPAKAASQVRLPRAGQAETSTREMEERANLQAIDDSVVRPEQPRGSLASIRADNTSLPRVRDRQRQEEEITADAATPAARARNESSALIDFYADAYEQRRAEDEAERQRVEQKRLQRIADDAAEAKAKASVAQNIIDADFKASKKALLLQNLDIVDGVMKLVKSWGPIAEKDFTYWQAAVNKVRGEKL